MKIFISNAIGLLFIFTLISCTEEIAEEVQNKEAVSADGSIADFSSRSLRLVHKMDEKLSFLMHKQGSFEAACELNAPTAGFSAASYTYDSPSYTVDCVLDVQELDLNFHGLSFELQVDDNLCEYVKYEPYSYWRFQPGATKRTEAAGHELYKVNCDDTCAAAAGSTACGKVYDNYTGGATAADYRNSGNYDNEVSAANYCYYDYATRFATSDPTWGNYPNCDEGVYQIRTVSITSDSGACDTLDISAVSDETSCGGDRYACLDGAGTEDLNFSEASSLITENMELESLSIAYSYGKLFGLDSHYSNIKLANYSRICAETGTTKMNLSDFSTVTFNGSEIEDIRGSTGTLTQDNGDNVAYADNLFRGSGAYTKPYYAFYCLDEAYDVKAQVRLFVREWDRTFEPDNIGLNAISDINYPTPLMDASFSQQSGGAFWNDVGDLDDFFHQDRDNDGTYGASGMGGDFTLWQNNSCTVSDNAFSSDNFPGKGRFRETDQADAP